MDQVILSLFQICLESSPKDSFGELIQILQKEYDLPLKDSEIEYLKSLVNQAPNLNNCLIGIACINKLTNKKAKGIQKTLSKIFSVDVRNIIIRMNLITEKLEDIESEELVAKITSGLQQKDIPQRTQTNEVKKDTKKQQELDEFDDVFI